MKIKLKNGIDFQIDKNEYNKGLNPSGMFMNIPKVKFKNNWYKCSISFKGNVLMIHDLMMVDDKTSLVSEHIKGVFHEQEISNFKKNFILFLHNSHSLNKKIFNLKKNITVRKKTISVFLLAIACSVIYYMINLFGDNSLMDWISKNLLAQTIIIFLTLSGFINIFTPFTIQKEFSKKDAEALTIKTIEEKKQEDEWNRKAQERASF